MTNKTKRLCGQCGERAVVGLARAGRTTTYKNLDLEIPSDVTVPTCENCGAEWIDETTAQVLDNTLEGAYHDKLRERFDTALKIILNDDSNQTRVERLLGVSPGYLSKLKLGKRQPSSEIVSVLALVSKSPKRRLAELEKFYHPQDGRKQAAG
jgi:NMD protein affecting ribosome stability and mRNA decay